MSREGCEGEFSVYGFMTQFDAILQSEDFWRKGVVLCGVYKVMSQLLDIFNFLLSCTQVLNLVYQNVLLWNSKGF